MRLPFDPKADSSRESERGWSRATAAWERSLPFTGFDDGRVFEDYEEFHKMPRLAFVPRCTRG